MKNTNAVRTEIHYAQVGEYQLPLLTLPQTDDSEPLGKYGRMRLAYLKNSASCAVQPDVAERYALAAFAGCPENGLRVAGTHDDRSVRQVPRAGQRARTASLGGAHERAESAGGRGGGEGSRVCRMIPDSIRTVSKADILDFILDFCGIFANFKIKI